MFNGKQTNGLIKAQTKELPIIIGVLFVFLFISSLFFWINSAQGSFVPEINYQGKLLAGDGDAVDDEDYNMRFRLCADSSCSSVLFDESHTGSDKVSVYYGLFSVMVGSVSTTAFSALDFNQDLYLEVSIGGTSTPPSWETLLPRKRLGAVPNAFNTQKFDGLATTSFLRADIANATGTINNFNSQYLRVSDNVGIGTTTPNENLSIIGNASANLFWDDTGDSGYTYTLESGFNLLRSVGVFGGLDSIDILAAVYGYATTTNPNSGGVVGAPIGVFGGGKSGGFFIGDEIGLGVLGGDLGLSLWVGNPVATSTFANPTGIDMFVAPNEGGRGIDIRIGPDMTDRNAKIYGINIAGSYISSSRNNNMIGINLNSTNWLYGLKLGTDNFNGWSIYSEQGNNYFGGNVGIGTTTPQTSLHVVGTSTLDVVSMDYNSWIGSALGSNSIQFGQEIVSNGSALDGLTFNTIDSAGGGDIADSIMFNDSLILSSNGDIDSHLLFVADGYDKIGDIRFNTSSDIFVFGILDDNLDYTDANYAFFGDMKLYPNTGSTNMMGFDTSLITDATVNASGTLGLMHNALSVSSDYSGVSDVLQDNKVFGNQIVRSGVISNYGYNTREINRSQRNWTDNLAVYSGTQDLYVYNYTQSLILRDDSEFNSPGYTLTSNNYNLHIDSVLTNTETAGTIDVKNYGVYLEHVDSSGVSLSNGSVDTIGIYLKNIEGHPSGRTYGIYDSSGENWYMSGNFGIGTSTPSEKLVVDNGSINSFNSFDYDYYDEDDLATTTYNLSNKFISGFNDTLSYFGGALKGNAGVYGYASSSADHVGGYLNAGVIGEGQYGLIGFGSDTGLVGAGIIGGQFAGQAQGLTINVEGNEDQQSSTGIDMSVLPYHSGAGLDLEISQVSTIGGGVYGLRVQDYSYGNNINDTNLYHGLDIDGAWHRGISVNNSSTTQYSIYSTGGLNYFGGSVGIGTTTLERELTVEGDLLVQSSTSSANYQYNLSFGTNKEIPITYLYDSLGLEGMASSYSISESNFDILDWHINASTTYNPMDVGFYSEGSIGLVGHGYMAGGVFTASSTGLKVDVGYGYSGGTFSAHGIDVVVHGNSSNQSTGLNIDMDMTSADPDDTSYGIRIEGSNVGSSTAVYIDGDYEWGVYSRGDNYFRGIDSQNIEAFNLNVASVLSAPSIYIPSFVDNGAVYVNGGFLTNVNPSSRDYKSNIADTNLDIDALLGLQVKTFTWNTNNQNDFGLIAEEIQEALPELYVDNGQVKGYRADHLPFYLLQIAQRQALQITELDNRIASGTIAVATSTDTLNLASIQSLTGLNYFEGNVGIGVINPQTKLSVVGTSTFQGDISVSGGLLDSTGNYGINGQILLSTGTSTLWVSTTTLGLGGSGSSLWSESGSDIYFSTGNVGIGTTTPQTALHVVGTSTLGATSMSYGSWIGSGLGTNSIQFTDYTISAGYGSGSNINLITASNDVSFLGVANAIGILGQGGSDASIILGNDAYAYTTLISQNSANNELTIAQVDSGMNPYYFSKMRVYANEFSFDGDNNVDLMLNFDGRGAISVATTTGYMNFTEATGYNFTGPVTTTRLYANQLFGSQLSVGILSGVLQATNGLVSVTTSPTFSGLNLLSYNGVLQATDGVVSANDSILVDDVKLSNLYFTTSSITSVPLINVTNTTDLHFSGASNYDWLDSGGRSFFNINSSSSQLTVTGNPSVIASNLSLPISMRNMHIVDGYLYAALYGSNSVDSFRIIDIADPYNPRVVGGQNINDLPHAPPKRVYANGNYAYLTYNTGTTTDVFRIIDISDKNNPRVISGANLDTQVYGGSGEPLYVSGNYVYILGVNIYDNSKSDLIIVDVSDPYNPSIISRLTDLPKEVWDVKVNGDYAYGCFHDEDSPLAIINIKNKKNPYLISTSSVGGINEHCWSIDFSGSRLYLGMGGFVGDASNTDVFRIVDVSNPSSPVVKGGSGLDFGLLADGNVGGFSFLKISGQYLYALSWGGYFYKIDISSSTAPEIEQSKYIDDPVGVDNAQSPLTFDFSGNHLFVGYAPIPSTGESTRYFRVFSMPGINSIGGYFSSLLSGSLKVNNDAIFDRRLSVADSLLVGSGGIFSDGGLSVISTTSVSYFGGQLTIGTTTATTTTSTLVVGGSILSTDLLGGVTTLSTDANGNIIRTPSDMRLKTDITLLDGVLDKVLALNPVSYGWKDTERFGSQREIGLLAQEVQEIFPEAVSGGAEYLSLNYQSLVPVLVSAVKEQQNQINLLAEGKELLPVSNTPNNTLTLQTNRLTVKESASFYGVINVIGRAGFASKVVFSDHVYFDQDSAGIAKLSAGATSTQISFVKPYEVVPIITITPKSKTNGREWWVEQESTSTFVIAINEPLDGDLEFNWQAIAVKINDASDNNPDEADVVLIEPPVEDNIINNTINSLEDFNNSPDETTPTISDNNESDLEVQENPTIENEDTQSNDNSDDQDIPLDNNDENQTIIPIDNAIINQDESIIEVVEIESD